MRSLHSFLRGTSLLGTAVLAWSLVPVDGEASPTALGQVSGGHALYLAHPGSAVLAMPAAPALPVLGLPSSVIPHSLAQCSVQTTTPPSNCSVTPVSSRRCSAHCDDGQQCSAFGSPGGTARCSSLGRLGGLCTTIAPPRLGTAPSQCSAFNSEAAATVQCSVMRRGNRQACSALNTNSVHANDCSTFPSPGANAMCSVLNGGVLNQNFCSVGRPSAASKLCSIFGGPADCSILAGQRGTCTNLKGAPTGSCSVQAGSGQCSVIGGAGGTRCVQ